MREDKARQGQGQGKPKQGKASQGRARQPKGKTSNACVMICLARGVSPLYRNNKETLLILREGERSRQGRGKGKASQVLPVSCLALHRGISPQCRNIIETLLI